MSESGTMLWRLRPPVASAMLLTDVAPHSGQLAQPVDAEEARRRQDSRFRCLRDRIRNESLTACDRNTIPVALYAIPTADGREMDQAQAFAEQREWRVTSISHDTDDSTPPTERPGWIHARRRVAAGYAVGVVAFRRGDLSLSDSLYEQELRWLRAHLGFLALVVPEGGVQ